MDSVRFNFVGNLSSKNDLKDLQSLDWKEGTIACTRHTWVWPLYFQLKIRGWPVSLSYSLEPNAINIIHGQVARRQLSAQDFRKYYIIGIRADFRPFPYGQYEIVQNTSSEAGRRIYMPLFSQPGLEVRDTDRNEVFNVCFSGRMCNGAIDPEKFGRDLQNMECHFLFKGEGHWHEMSDVDILIGIRSFSQEPHHSKPASKLINAWLSEIPFIGGYDSAYEQVGMPGENYLRVSSYDELLAAIKQLKNDAEFYQRLVKAGKEAGENYTTEKIVQLWEQFLDDQAVPDYKVWVRTPFSRIVRGTMNGIWFLLRERITPVLLTGLRLPR